MHQGERGGGGDQIIHNDHCRNEITFFVHLFIAFQGKTLPRKMLGVYKNLILLVSQLNSRDCHTFKEMSHYQGNVKIERECQNCKEMSKLQGNVTFSREYQTFKGMSHFQGNVKLTRECQTYMGMSNVQGNVKLSGMCKTFKGKLYFQENFTLSS